MSNEANLERWQLLSVVLTFILRIICNNDVKNSTGTLYIVVICRII